MRLVRNGHLDGGRETRFNRPVLLYTLVANDCEFAVDVFSSRDLAERALRDTLADEPAFLDLLAIRELVDD